MSAQLTWQEPPDGEKRKGPLFADEAALLRQHPGRAAVIEKFPVDLAPRARSLSHNISSGRYSAFQPPGSFGSRSITEEEHDEHGVLVRVVNVYAWFTGAGDGS
jgi:hypothetical protein